MPALSPVLLGAAWKDTAARTVKRQNMKPRLETRFCILAIVAYPLLLMLVNNSWVFGDPFAITMDDHFYTGYFFNLRQYLIVHPDVYYGTRLPWILFGYAVHALAAPELAQYILRLALCYAAAFSLFSIIRVLFADNFAALIGTLLMVTHTGFLSAIGWDYINGPGIILILVGTALLTSATRSRHWRWALVGAGAAQAAMVSNNLFLAVLAPVQLAWYAVIDRRSQRNPIPTSLVFLSLGALAMLGALGGINFALSGPFLFLTPQATGGAAVAQNPAVWRPRDSSWIRHATWLVLPGMASMAGLIVGAEMMFARARRRRLSQQDVYAAVSIVQLLVVLGLFIVLDEVAGFWLLYYPYYASYLFPFVYIAVGAILARAMVSVPSPWPILAVAATCLLAPFTPWVARGLPACAPGCDLAGVVGAMAVVATIFLASAGLTGSVPIIMAAVAAFGILNVSLANTTVFSFPPDGRRRAAALTVFDAIRAIQPYDRDGALRFWYNWYDPLGGIFTAISSTHLWHITLVSTEFPKFTDPKSGTARVSVLIAPGVGERILILSAQDNWRARAERTLAPLGLRAVPLGHRRIQRGAVAFDLGFVELQPAAEAPAVRISPLEMTPMAAATIMPRGPGVTIRTGTERWSWAGRLPISQMLLRRYGDSHAVVRVHLRVSRGRVGIGIWSDTRAAYTARHAIPAGPMAVDVSLGIPRLDEPSALIVDNWSVRGESVVEVESISIAAYAVPAPR